MSNDHPSPTLRQQPEAAAGGWQPIETVPPYPFVQKDWFISGPRYLLWQYFAFTGSYGYTERGKGRWIDPNGRIVNPTHWMPLPDAPLPEPTSAGSASSHAARSDDRKETP